MSERLPVSFRAFCTRFALVVVCFAVANVLLGLSLDFARDRCVKGETGVIVNARRVAPEVLVLGSSRAKYHYDDALLSKELGVKVFNAGDEGKGLPFSRVVYEQVAAVHVPRLVVVDVMLCDEDMERVHTLDPWYDRSVVLRSMPSSDGEPAATDWKTPLLMKLPAYRYSGEAFKMIKGACSRGADTGFAGLDGAGPPGGPGKSPVSGWFVAQLDALVKECRARGSAVVLCFSPAADDRLESPVVVPARDYARRSGFVFIKFDAAFSPVFADTKLYRDAIHLNREGAEIFTGVLSRELKKLLGPGAREEAPR